MLYVVPTPIGNLEDITLRALRILKSVDQILAEDTRHTAKLLHYYEIQKPLLSYHQHSPPQRLQEILELLILGRDLALVSDAGMPGISDPGLRVIQACWEHKLPVEVLPGANACLTALVASGLETERFVFEGFLPAKGETRQARLARLSMEPRTMVLYEAPHHLQQTLKDLARWLSNEREVVAARELTKLYAEVWRGTLAEAQAHFSQPRGEFTLVIRGLVIEKKVIEDQFLLHMLGELTHKGLSPSAAIRLVSEQTGIARNYVYQLSLKSLHNRENSERTP